MNADVPSTTRVNRAGDTFRELLARGTLTYEEMDHFGDRNPIVAAWSGAA